MTIHANTVVSFRFVMYDSKGNILQDTMSGVGTSYLHGGSTIASELQQHFTGLESGSEAEISVNDSTGHYRFRVHIDNVRHANETEIALGYPVESGEFCEDDCDCYNN